MLYFSQSLSAQSDDGRGRKAQRTVLQHVLSPIQKSLIGEEEYVIGGFFAPLTRATHRASRSNQTSNNDAGSSSGR